MLTWVDKANEYGRKLSNDQLVEFVTEACKFITTEEEYEVPDILRERIHYGCVCGSSKCYTGGIQGIVCRCITKYDSVVFHKARDIVKSPVGIRTEEIYKKFEMDCMTYTKDVGDIVSIYAETHSCYDRNCEKRYCNGKGKDCIYCRESCTYEYCDCCAGENDSDGSSASDDDSTSSDDDVSTDSNDEVDIIPEWKKKYITKYHVVTGKCFADEHMSGDEFDVGPDHA